MSVQSSHLLLDRPEPRKQLIQAYYEAHHTKSRDIGQAEDEKKKVEFFRRKLTGHKIRMENEADLVCWVVLRKSRRVFLVLRLGEF
jgi:hypothetical protein